MSKVITLEQLLAGSEKEIVLPLRSKELGEEFSIRVRKLGMAEHVSFYPTWPPEAASWPPGEAAAKEREWAFRTPDVAEAYRDIPFRVAARVALEPTLTVEQARRLGSDAEVVYFEVRRFSGLLPETASGANATTTTEQAPPAAPAKEATEPTNAA